MGFVVIKMHKRCRKCSISLKSNTDFAKPSHKTEQYFTGVELKSCKCFPFEVEFVDLSSTSSASENDGINQPLIIMTNSVSIFYFTFPPNNVEKHHRNEALINTCVIHKWMCLGLWIGKQWICNIWPQFGFLTLPSYFVIQVHISWVLPNSMFACRQPRTTLETDGNDSFLVPPETYWCI